MRPIDASAGAEAFGRNAGELDRVASRVLEELGAPAFSGPTGVLRAYAAHLRSRGRRLVVRIRRPGDGRALDELAVLLRGSLQIVAETRAKDPVSRDPRRTTAAPAADGAPRTRRCWPLGLALAGALAAVLAGILLAAVGRDEVPVAAPATRTSLALVGPGAAETAPEPRPGRQAATARAAPIVEPPVARRPQRHAGTTRDEVSDAVRSGRRALAALANARSDAEWEEGTRILHELGPQPALMDSLDELGAKPGCVRKRGCVSTRARLEAALCTAWAHAVERGEAPAGLRCS